MKRILILSRLFVGLFFVTACSHGPLASHDPISLDLKGHVGHSDNYAIFSQTLVENIKDNQLVNQKMDIVDFEVNNKITKVDPSQNVYVVSRTTRKDGTMQLHDMAYPELNENIEFVFNKVGNVIKAGKYPQKSLFFVPPLPLPNKKVAIGDTWTYQGEWKSSSLQGPMLLKLKMQLVKIVSCFEKELCAGVEWKGSVEPAEAAIKLPVESMIHGYTLYRPQTGSQLWTYTRNVESFMIQNLKLMVSSCVQSILKSDQSGLNPLIKKDPYCDPSKDEMAYFENPN